MKPILFNTEMVEAILKGQKTESRRVMKPQPGKNVTRLFPLEGKQWKGYFGSREEGACMKPKYQKGDVLYIRETWAHGYIDYSDNGCSRERWFEPSRESDGEFLKGISSYFYRANMSQQDQEELHMLWKPAIHMPKEAARIFLKVTDVRAERLQNMGIYDALQEGVPVSREELNRMNLLNQWEGPEVMAEFRKLWDSTIQKEAREKFGWDGNPWVWVYEFERIRKPEV